MRGSLYRRLLLDRKGNVVVIFALALVPLIFLFGMAVDFGVAINRWSMMNVAADAAALAAVSPTLMNQTASAATSAATNVFNAQASAISGVSYTPPTIVVTQRGLSRTATVSYGGSSSNAFAGILGLNGWPISGTASASARAAPNIDFYMMLDNSPSMAIAATTAGINTMVANTLEQDGGLGCAFACHESNANPDDTLGNPLGEDNWTLARRLGVATRIQNLATATQTLAGTAANVEAQNGNAIRMGILTFTSNNLGTELQTVEPLTSDLAAAGAAAAGVDVLVVCKGNYVACSDYDDSTDTDFATALSDVNALVPAPGTGGVGDSPKEVLFIVTDGVEDKQASYCSYPQINLSGFGRCIQPFDTSNCTAVKSRGIQIAILYTQYYPLPNEPFYVQYVAPFQPDIGPNLQSCASPGLFFTTTTDQDMASAMTALFNAAVTSAEAHLTQ